MAPVAAPPRRAGSSVLSWLSSEYAQSSLQLGVGLFIACLFTYILPISFPPMSCVVATWLCVVAVMASPANHLGVRINSACSVLGSTWVGAVLGAAATSISHATGPMYSPQSTAVLGVLAAIVLAILAPVRVALSPPTLWAQGMNASLAFGLTALNTYVQAGVARTWYIAGTLVLANTVAAVAVVLVAALVLPTLATKEVQSAMADTLLLSGVATSRYAGRLFRPPKTPAASQQHPGPAATATTTNGSATATTTNSSATDTATAVKQQGQQKQPREAAGAAAYHTSSPPTSTAAAGAPTSSSSASAFSAFAGSAADTTGSSTEHSTTASTEDAAAAKAALATADSLIEQLAASELIDIPTIITTAASGSNLDLESGGGFVIRSGSGSVGGAGGGSDVSRMQRDASGRGGVGGSGGFSVVVQDGAAAAAAAGAGGGGGLYEQQSSLSSSAAPAQHGLVMREAHTEQEWLDVIRRHSNVKLVAPDASSHPQPQPPIGALRPRLAKARTLFMSGSAVEPQWMRGGWGTLVGRPGCFWFETAAWRKAAGALQVLLTRLSALEAVIEDGESLHSYHTPGIEPAVLDLISVAFSRAATSLAHMSNTVRVNGSRSAAQNPIASQAARASAAAAAEGSSMQGGGKSVDCDPGSGVTSSTKAGGSQQTTGGAGGGSAQPANSAGAAAAAAEAAAAAVDVVCGRAVGSQHCWQAIKKQLSALMAVECETHWTAVIEAAADSPVVVPTLTGVRHLMFTWSLTNAIIDAVNDLELAVTAAVCASPPCALPPPPAASSTVAGRNNSTSSISGQAPATKGGGLTTSSLNSDNNNNTSSSSSSGLMFLSGFTGLLKRLWGWVLPCLPALSGKDQAVYIYKTWCCDLPQQLKEGRCGIRAMCSSRAFQAGFKYWLVLAVLFEVTLLVLYAVPAIRPLGPAFGFVAASLSMSEKVEATVSKFVFWALGTIFGGALGFLAMWHPALALNPYGLVVVMVVVALVVGLLGVTKARVGITLVLMTLSTLILCQCCGHVGLWAISVTRVASVLFGVTLSVLVCNLVMPLYTSTWSIQTMRSAFITSVQLICQMHVEHYADGAAAVAAYHARTPNRCPLLRGPDADAAAADAGGVDAAALAAAPHPDVGAVDPTTKAATAPSCLTQSADDAAAAAYAASQVAAAAGAASAAIAEHGHPTCPVHVTPGVLEGLVARPLIAVQTSLLMDTVSWQRGVLATPPVVPALLRAMYGMLDRLAGLQLALQPPRITQAYTGLSVVNYGVPMAGQVCEMLGLASRLAAAVADVLEAPSCEHRERVHEALSALQAHRVGMYTRMQQLRQQLHIDVHAQHRKLQQLLRQQQALQSQQQEGQTAPRSAAGLEQQICPVKRQMAVVLGGVDDSVRYLTFQFASIKALNMVGAVAEVAARDACRKRNTTTSVLK